MLTPVFSCEQDGTFVIVRIVLSAICKVLEAAFDINGGQFTFHCRPYYLRLKFNEPLEEGKGERATYDLESNTLTVYLPKASPGQHFTQLDNLGFLVATELQRRHLITVVGGDDNDDEEEDKEDGRADADADPETEFVQTLQAGSAAAAGAASMTAAAHYGFANHFSGLFARADADIVSEMVDLPDPEAATVAQRRALRLAAEEAAFDEEAVLVAFEDEDGEVAAVLRHTPAHMADFQRALQAEGVVFASLPSAGAVAPSSLRAGMAEGLEEEEGTLPAGGGGSVNIWQGNLADFTRPLIEEVGGEGDATPTAAAAAATTPTPSALPAAAAGTRLAIPKVRPALVFTTEENDALLRLAMPRLLFPPSPEAVAALTLDLLLAEAYNDLVTEGQGCSESLWNLTTLSPSLTYLDAPETAYDACVAFARRALVYPLHRHFALVQRAYAAVGTLLLLGRQYTVRALLRARRVLSHSEHKHVLSTLFLDPLIAYWMNISDGDARLLKIGLELHAHATRTQPIAVRGKSAAAGASALLVTEETRMLPPINVLTVGLPFATE